MWDTARMAGFFAAHAVWSVSNGEMLVPMYGYEKSDGARGLDRFPGDIKAGAASAHTSLRGNPHEAVNSVVILDAFINLPDGQTDALMVEAVGHPPHEFLLRMAIPYRPASSEEGFAVYRPKFIEVDGAGEDDYGDLGRVFFEGVEAHEHAAPIWLAAMDDSK
jgi:hypothetical protein